MLAWEAESHGALHPGQQAQSGRNRALAQAASVLQADLQALPGRLERMPLACRRNASAEATMGQQPPVAYLNNSCPRAHSGEALNTG